MLQESTELFAPSQETAKQQGKAACKQPLAVGKNTPHGVLYPPLRKIAL